MLYFLPKLFSFLSSKKLNIINSEENIGIMKSNPLPVRSAHKVISSIQLRLQETNQN